MFLVKVYMKGILFFNRRPCLIKSETAKQGYFCTPIFDSETRKNSPELIFFSASETGYMDLRLLHTAEHSYHINIESLSQRSPAWPGVSAYTQPQGFCWDDFRIFQIQLNGKKAKKKESKEKKTQRTEMKKQKERRRKKVYLLLQVGFEPTTHTPGSWAKIVCF